MAFVVSLLCFCARYESNQLEKMLLVLFLEIEIIKVFMFNSTFKIHVILLFELLQSYGTHDLHTDSLFLQHVDQLRSEPSLFIQKINLKL